MRPRSLLSSLMACTLAAACSSTDAAPGNEAELFVGPPTQVRWIMFKSGQTISLVNRSHTDPLKLYSEVREEVGPKVTTDDVMDGLVQHFEEQGFGDHAQDGPAPTTGDAQYTQALELEVGGRVTHMTLGSVSSEEEREVFYSCSSALMTVWNLTYQVQAVENDKGEAIFRTGR